MKWAIFFILLILTGCFYNPAILNLPTFDLPDDKEFIATINELDTPYKVWQYMEENFTYKSHPYNAVNPYELWQTGLGDCNDFSTWFAFVLNYHGYEIYQIRILKDYNHWLGVVVLEDIGYAWLSNLKYYPYFARATFGEIVDTYCSLKGCSCTGYEVYDYEMNVVEEAVK